MILAIANGENFLAIYAETIKIYKAKGGIKYSFFKKRGASYVTSLPIDIVRDSNKLNSISKRSALAGRITKTTIISFKIVILF